MTSLFDGQIGSWRILEWLVYLPLYFVLLKLLEMLVSSIAHRHRDKVPGELKEAFDSSLEPLFGLFALWPFGTLFSAKGRQRVTKWAEDVLVVLFVASTLSAFGQYARQERSGPHVPLVGVMLWRRARRLTAAYSVLIVISIVHIVWSRIAKTDPSISLIFSVSLLLLSFFAYQKALEFRIKRGYYGTNEEDAREIISFIFKNADDFDAGGGGRIVDILYPLIPEERGEHVVGLGELA